MAGITLRLARSPDAPNKTPVPRSVPFAPPERFASMFVGLPSVRFRHFPWNQRRLTLYLNVVFLQIRAKLLCVLIMDHVHAQSSWALEIQKTVVDEHALLGRPLCDRQRHPENQLFRLARMHIARAEENQKIT